MKIRSLKVYHSNLDKIVNYVADKVKFEYENHSSDMSILLYESFHLRTMSGQVDMVIFKLNKDYIYIDILAGGGGEGILNLDLWSENEFIRCVENVLNEYVSNEEVIIETITTLE